VSDLLTLEDIADLWKVPREYAQRRLVKLPEFPDPAPGSTRKNQRWRAADVYGFLRGENSPAETPA
jgi:hypothetical protein